MRTITHPTLPKPRRNEGLGSHLPRAWPRILAATAVALLVSILQSRTDIPVPNISPVPFTMLGIGISIFLGFRNTAAYARFWEARTLWGAHINASRSFARQVMTLIVTDSDELRPFQEDVVMATIAYSHAFQNHLQDDDPLDGIEKLMLPSETEWLRTQGNVPVATLQLIGRRLAYARACGWISTSASIILEGTLVDLTAVQGGCERIKNTPVPQTYATLSRTVVTFFCIFLPLGILDEVTWLTPFVTFVVAYAFCGLDALGDEVTAPFGHAPNDLPLERYTHTIETNLLQLLEDDALPDFAVAERPQLVNEGVSI